MIAQIPQRDRRDYIPYFHNKDKETRDGNLALIWMFILFLFCVSAFIHLFVEPIVAPPKARAEQTGPMTNKEACQDLKNGGFVQGGHMKDIVDLCKREGVNL